MSTKETKENVVKRISDLYTELTTKKMTHRREITSSYIVLMYSARRLGYKTNEDKLFDDKDIRDIGKNSLGLNLIEENRRLFIKYNVHSVLQSLSLPIFLMTIFSKEILYILGVEFDIQSIINNSDAFYHKIAAFNKRISNIKKDKVFIGSINFKFKKIRDELLPLYVFFIERLAMTNTFASQCIISKELMFPKLDKTINEIKNNADKMLLETNVSPYNIDMYDVLIGFMTMHDIESRKIIKHNNLMLFFRMLTYVAENAVTLNVLFDKTSKIGKIFDVLTFNKDLSYSKKVSYVEIYNEIYSYIYNMIKKRKKRELSEFVKEFDSIYTEMLNISDDDEIEDNEETIEYNRKSIEDITKRVKSNILKDIKKDNTKIENNINEIVDEDEL